MKKCSCLLAAVMLIHAATFAQTRQPVPPASYEDTVLGWMNVYSVHRRQETAEGRRQSLFRRRSC